MLQYTVTLEGTVIVNGTPITLNTRADLLAVKRYIDEYLGDHDQRNRQQQQLAGQAEPPP